MQEAKKQFNVIILIFCVFILVALSLLSVVCYFSFDQNYREIKQQYYSAISGQIISEMETSIRYGKRIDRYYGIDQVFDRSKQLFEAGFEMAVTAMDGTPLYYSFEADGDEAEVLLSQNFEDAIAEHAASDTYTLFEQGQYESLIQTITDETGEKAGCFVLIYPSSVYQQQRSIMLRDTVRYMLYVFGGALVALGICYLALRGKVTGEEKGKSEYRLFAIPAMIIMCAILVQGVVSYNLYQNKYQEALYEDAEGIVQYVSQVAESVHEKGVPYDEMFGLSDYLAKKVQDVPVLWNLRLSKVMSDSDEVLNKTNSVMVSIPINALQDENLCIEAQISQEYVQGKMWELFFMFLATFIFCVVIIVELIKLPKMIDARRRKEFGDENERSYEQVTIGVRIASFLRCTGNYLYLPYSAMLIRQWKKSVLGLSVGMTAALPLAVESAGQVIGIMLYPVFFKKPDRKSRVFFVACIAGTVVVNFVCFLTHSALAIILLRFLGGLLYAGFMHVLNIIISCGYDSEQRHQVNLAQSNAGLIGGIMCGAGVGAIIASLGGYAAPYMVSAVVFACFGVFVMGLMPWKVLMRNAERKELGKGEEDNQTGKVSKAKKWRLSPRTLLYFILVIVPVNFGILYVVTLIPALVGEQGSTILLSYCYIVNGVAGFYFGPKLVAALGKKLGQMRCIALALLIAACGLFLLDMPPFMVMILAASTVFGLFDGFGTPMATDGFLCMPDIKENMDEVSAMAVYFMLCNVVTIVGPMVIEFILQGDTATAIMGTAVAYVICTVLFLVTLGRSYRKKNIGTKDVGA